MIGSTRAMQPAGSRVVLALAGLLLAAPLAFGPARADDVIMFRDGAIPSADELATIMFPPAAGATGEAPAQVKTRGIRFTSEPEAVPAPATQPGTAVASTDTQAPPAAGVVVGFNINFALGSAELAPETLPYIDRVGEMLKLDRAQGQSIVIAGHADASGPADFNLALSRERARAVSRYLQGRHGISAARIETVGMGEQQPLPGTDPYDGINRRVEFRPVQ